MNDKKKMKNKKNEIMYYAFNKIEKEYVSEYLKDILPNEYRNEFDNIKHAIYLIEDHSELIIVNYRDTATVMIHLNLNNTDEIYNIGITIPNTSYTMKTYINNNYKIYTDIEIVAQRIVEHML